MLSVAAAQGSQVGGGGYIESCRLEFERTSDLKLISLRQFFKSFEPLLGRFALLKR